jgi:hypothetical protein
VTQREVRSKIVTVISRAEIDEAANRLRPGR